VNTVGTIIKANCVSEKNTVQNTKYLPCTYTRYWRKPWRTFCENGKPSFFSS